MTSSQPSVDANNATRFPFEFSAAAFVLVAAISQYSVGAVFDKTGEQIRGGLPIATAIVALATLAVIIQRKRLDWPTPSWAQVIFLTSVSIGLYGLHRSELKSGLKEAIQIAEVFGIAWYLFATLPSTHHRRLFWTMGIIGVLLIPLAIGDLHTFKPFMVSDARLAALQIMTVPFVIYAFRSRPVVLASILVASATVNGLFLVNGIAFLGLLAMVAISLFVLSPKSLWMAALMAVVTIGLSFVGSGDTRVWDSFSSQYGDGYSKRLYVETVAATKGPNHYPAGGGLGEYKRTINQLKPLLDLEISPTENKIPKDGNNQYLLTLVEAGLPAALAFLGLFLATSISAFRHKADEQTNLVCALACIGLVIGSAFTTTLGRGIGIWTGAILGLTCAIVTAQQSKPTEALSRLIYPVCGFLLGFLVIFFVNKGEKRNDHVNSMNRRLRKVLRLAPVRPIQSGNSSGLTVITANGQETTPQSPVGIRVEGEAFDTVTGALKKAKANDASGGSALYIPLNSGKGTGEATYTVRIPKAGRYLLRARVYWEDGCSNSIKFAVNKRNVTLTSERFNEWHELSGHKELSLTEGSVSVRVENVEDGIRLDYFELIPVN